MGLPLPASKGTPSPAEINCVTRAAGNFTTIRSSTSIAKIDLLILIALDPKPLPPAGTATPLTLAYSSQSDSNNADGFSLAGMIISAASKDDGRRAFCRRSGRSGNTAAKNPRTTLRQWCHHIHHTSHRYARALEGLISSHPSSL